MIDNQDNSSTKKNQSSKIKRYPIIIIIGLITIIVIPLILTYNLFFKTNHSKSPTDIDPNLPISQQWSPEITQAALTITQDLFYKYRDERGMYSSLITCSNPENCEVNEPNHRNGLGMIWGLNQRFLQNQSPETLTQLTTVINDYQNLINTREYVFQNNNFNCLFMYDIWQNPAISPIQKTTLEEICQSSINEYYLNDLEIASQSAEQQISETTQKLLSLSQKPSTYDWEKDLITPQLKNDQFLEGLSYNYFLYLPDAIIKYQWQNELGRDTEKIKKEIILNFDQLLSIIYYHQNNLGPIDKINIAFALEKGAQFYSDIGNEELSLAIRSYQQDISQSNDTQISANNWQIIKELPIRSLAQLALINHSQAYPNQALTTFLNTYLIDNFYVNQSGLIGFSDSVDIRRLPRFDSFVNGILLGLIPRE